MSSFFFEAFGRFVWSIYRRKFVASITPSRKTMLATAAVLAIGLIAGGAAFARSAATNE